MHTAFPNSYFKKQIAPDLKVLYFVRIFGEEQRLPEHGHHGADSEIFQQDAQTDLWKGDEYKLSQEQ